MILQTVEYALRAIVTIPQREGAPCTSREITQVPAPYLSKMMQGMVRANLVTSKRGLHIKGLDQYQAMGLMLPANNITILYSLPGFHAGLLPLFLRTLYPRTLYPRTPSPCAAVCSGHLQSLSARSTETKAF